MSRIVRWIGWDRNPLRRTSDRLEAALTALLVSVLLLLGPWAGWRAAQATYRAQVEAVAWERQHRFPVQAILLTDATWKPPAVDELPAPEFMFVQASWTAPNGVVHTGPVLTNVGATAGTTTGIWTDEHGTVTASAARRSPGVRASFAALVTVGAIAAFLGTVRLLTQRHLQHRRMRSWQAEWIVVEPGWSGRRP